jgi:hypothetical protein
MAAAAVGIGRRISIVSSMEFLAAGSPLRGWYAQINLGIRKAGQRDFWPEPRLPP